MERKEVEEKIAEILRKDPGAVIEVEEEGILGRILGKTTGQYFETRGEYGIVIREFSRETEENLKKKPLISFSSIVAIRHLSILDLLDKINSHEKPVRSAMRGLNAIGSGLKEK
jgi:hypothetical protein